MGTDIHLFVEARKAAGEPWELVAIKSQCDWCDGKKVARDGSQCYGCKGSGEAVGFGCRNYNTFAILAGVRNGSGFAGCDMGDGFVPVAEPRGLPEDMSAELKCQMATRGTSEDRDVAFLAAFGEDWLGDHSHSHLPLSSLIGYNWNRRTNLRGVVQPREFRTFLEKGAPDSWCGDVWGGSVRVVSNETMARLLEIAEFSDDRHSQTLVSIQPGSGIVGIPVGSTVYTRVQWSVSYKETSQTFYNHFLPAMCHFATRNGIAHGDMRIVFGFDS